jgi:SAM-dependent methyltransferase
VIKDEAGMQRRVAGDHDIRLDGIQDLYTRALGASVFDIGCNRGLVALDMAKNGAQMCHGCDNYEEGINVARHIFADLRSVKSQFECVDLSAGVEALKPFKDHRYDMTLCLATYHKLKRIMPADTLSELFVHFGKRTIRYFAWRATSDKSDENEEEMAALDRDMKVAGLQRIHTSYISRQLGVAAIWERR